MANPEHVEIVKAGKKAIDEWWKNHSAKEIKDKFPFRLQNVSFDLTGADLRGLVLHDAKLACANFVRANLAQADFSGSDLRNSYFYRLDLRQVNFTKTCLKDAHMEGADLERQLLLETNLDGAYLYGACLRRVHIEDCSLQRVGMSEANLRDVRIYNSSLHDSWFYGAKMNRARIFGCSLFACKMQRVDLRRAFFYGVQLSKAELMDADFRDAVLRDVQLYETDLSRAKLDGIDFHGITTDKWTIDSVSCTHFFTGSSLDLNNRHQRRIPHNGHLQEGEFEDRFKSRPTIEFIFEHGMPAFGPALLGIAVDQANLENPESSLRILSIDARGGIPRAVIEIAEKVSKKNALALVDAYYQQKFAQMQKEIESLKDDKQALLCNTSQRILLPAMESLEDELIRITDAARILGFTKGTISRWADKGKIRDNGKKKKERRVSKLSVLSLKHKLESEDVLKDAAEDLQDRASKISDRH